MRACALGFVVLLLATTAGGCSGGSSRPAVGGRVTVGGQPVAHGTITFEAEDGKPDAAWIEDGRYHFQTGQTVGLPPGRYKVSVVPRQPTGPEPQLVGQETKPVGATGPTIPEKYHQAATSGLTVEVKGGDNRTFDFDLAP